MQVIQDLDVGGAQRTVVMLCNGLARRGHKVLLVALQTAGPQQALLQDSRGIRLDVLGIVRSSIATPIRFLRDTNRLNAALCQRLQDFRPEIVQTHYPDDAMLMDRCTRRSGIGCHVPIIHSQRFYLTRRTFDLRSRLRLMLFRGVLKRAARVVAVSRAVKQTWVELAGLGPNAIEVLHNGTDLSGFRSLPDRQEARSELGLPPDRPLVMSVGRLSRPKDYPLLVRASALVLQHHPEVLFVLVGEGSERQRIEAEIVDHGVAESWILLGQRMDVARCLAAADLFALSSEWEGFPVAIIEAMAAGLPIAATNVAGVGEIIEQGKTGLLVPAGQVDRLSDAICQLLSDRDGAGRLAHAARSLALSQYDLDSYIDRVEAVLGEVVARS